MTLLSDLEGRLLEYDRVPGFEENAARNSAEA
jgi:hypothetical protein